AGARDGYVYHYFIRRQGSPGGLGVHKPGMIDPARVTVADLMDLSIFQQMAECERNRRSRRNGSKGSVREYRVSSSLATTPPNRIVLELMRYDRNSFTWFLCCEREDPLTRSLIKNIA
ncbi:MAG: hypothetical protein ACC661_03120, partial [Verrucomicrobiales bacterium]